MLIWVLLYIDSEIILLQEHTVARRVQQYRSPIYMNMMALNYNQFPSVVIQLSDYALGQMMAAVGVRWLRHEVERADCFKYEVYSFTRKE